MGMHKLDHMEGKIIEEINCILFQAIICYNILKKNKFLLTPKMNNLSFAQAFQRLEPTPTGKP